MKKSELVQKLRELAESSMTFPYRQTAPDMIDEIAEVSAETPGNIADHIIDYLRLNRLFRNQLVQNYREMETELSTLSDREQEIDRMMQFLSTFTNAESLPGDRRAFSRWMDVACVRERARCALHEREHVGAFAVRLLSAHIHRQLEAHPHTLRKWMKSLEQPVQDVLWVEYDESPRWENRVVISDLLLEFAGRLSSDEFHHFIGDNWVTRIFNQIRSPETNVWVRLKAVEVGSALDFSRVYELILAVFRHPETGRDSMFYRSGLVKILVRSGRLDSIHTILAHIFTMPDPSEHVRISAAGHLESLPPEMARSLFQLVNRGDKPGCTDKVQAMATIRFFAAMGDDVASATWQEAVKELIAVTLSDPGVSTRRAAVETLAHAALQYGEAVKSAELDALEFDILQTLDRIISHGKFPDLVRRIAAQKREAILILKNPESRALVKILSDKTRNLSEGDSVRITLPEVSDDDLLGRAMALICQNQFSLIARKTGPKTYILYKGDRYKRSLWRILKELRSPDPAKRQGFLHSVGRVIPGELRAPTHILAEITETKVPGERVFLSEEASARPYIPMVDDLMSLCSGEFAGKEVKIYSAEGITVLKSPKKFFRRLSLWMNLTLNYSKYANMRNIPASQLDFSSVRGLVQAAREDLGIHISFIPHTYQYRNKDYFVIDPKLARNLFPIAGEVV